MTKPTESAEHYCPLCGKDATEKARMRHEIRESARRQVHEYDAR